MVCIKYARKSAESVLLTYDKNRKLYIWRETHCDGC